MRRRCPFHERASWDARCRSFRRRALLGGPMPRDTCFVVRHLSPSVMLSGAKDDGEGERRCMPIAGVPGIARSAIAPTRCAATNMTGRGRVAGRDDREHAGDRAAHEDSSQGCCETPCLDISCVREIGARTRHRQAVRDVHRVRNCAMMTAPSRSRRERIARRGWCGADARLENESVL